LKSGPVTQWTPKIAILKSGPVKQEHIDPSVYLLQINIHNYVSEITIEVTITKFLEKKEDKIEAESQSFSKYKRDEIEVKYQEYGTMDKMHFCI